MSCGTSCPNPLVDSETPKPNPKCDDICPDGQCTIKPSDILDLKWENPEIKKVTEIVITGEGQFDRYMRAGYEQLKRHYEDGRIKGADFTSAHIQMTELMMTQANAYVLQKYKLDAELQLMELEFKMKLEKDRLERDILKAQLAKLKSDCELTVAQRGKVLADTQLSVTQEIETRKTGAVDRGAKKAQSQLTQTQCSELVLNGESKRQLESSQKAVADQQVMLYQAQAKGFTDKNRNDTFKTVMNAWAVSVSELANEHPPGSLDGFAIDSTIQSALSHSDGLNAGSPGSTMP